MFETVSALLLLGAIAMLMDQTRSIILQTRRISDARTIRIVIVSLAILGFATWVFSALNHSFSASVTSIILYAFLPVTHVKGRQNQISIRTLTILTVYVFLWLVLFSRKDVRLGANFWFFIIPVKQDFIEFTIKVSCEVATFLLLRQLIGRGKSSLQCKFIFLMAILILLFLRTISISVVIVRHNFLGFGNFELFSGFEWLGLAVVSFLADWTWFALLLGVAASVSTGVLVDTTRNGNRQKKGKPTAPPTTKSTEKNPGE